MQNPPDRRPPTEGTPSSGGHEPRPNRKSRRADRKHSVSRGKRTLSPDTVVGLSPQGLEFYQQMLAAASAEAGRAISGEDLLEVLRRVRIETGTDDFEFSDPKAMDCFRAQLKKIGQEPPPQPPQPPSPPSPPSHPSPPASPSPPDTPPAPPFSDPFPGVN